MNLNARLRLCYAVVFVRPTSTPPAPSIGGPLSPSFIRNGCNFIGCNYSARSAAKLAPTYARPSALLPLNAPRSDEMVPPEKDRERRRNCF